MRGRRIRVGAATLALISIFAILAGCEKAPVSSEDNTEQSNPVRLYGTDGNMSNSFAEVLAEFPGVLQGMKGTTPLTPLSDDFKRRVLAVDPAVEDFHYAGEAYDAVIIAGLAAEYARSNEPAAIAKQIVGMTTGGTVCDSLAACLVLARAGKDLQYRGIALRRSGLTESGEPSSAMYGTISFGHDNKIDESRTEYIGAGDETTANRGASPPVGTAKPARGAVLKIGGLLPRTGRLSFAGPPMFASARLAINEINAAGGVLGQPVTWIDGDDGTSAEVAAATTDRLIGQGVHVIIGAGASGVTKAVLPKALSAGRVMISPSATSDELSRIDDKGLFFRTSPPDQLQAKALADIIVRDGRTRVAIVATEDPYGLGLQQNVENDLVAAGLKRTDIKLLKYPTKDKYEPETDFAQTAADIKAFNPDGVLIVGFDESALLIKALLGRKMAIRG